MIASFLSVLYHDILLESEQDDERRGMFKAAIMMRTGIVRGKLFSGVGLDL